MIRRIDLGRGGSCGNGSGIYEARIEDSPQELWDCGRRESRRIAGSKSRAWPWRLVTKPMELTRKWVRRLVSLIEEVKNSAREVHVWLSSAKHRREGSLSTIGMLSCAMPSQSTGCVGVAMRTLVRRPRSDSAWSGENEWSVENHKGTRRREW